MGMAADPRHRGKGRVVSGGAPAGVGGPWSAEQREWLRMLGHEPYRHAGLPEDPLLHALLRAAGRDPSDAGAATRLLADLPPVATLRGDAAAKRRLWPRLRALRTRPG